MRKWLVWLAFFPAWLRAEEPLLRDDFNRGLFNWAVEQEPGGVVAVVNNGMVIGSEAGSTVWLREPLQAPVTISYVAEVRSSGRVSDLNCFWMAMDPARPDDLFAEGHKRDGKFASYDSLRTYYVGYGGNNNTTTRFRRYDGTGARPLLPQHDLSAPEFLLKADHAYRITLVAGADGRVQFIRDGEVVFDWTDPEPLRRGWFGFRSVNSKIRISEFLVHAGMPPSAVSR